MRLGAFSGLALLLAAGAARAQGSVDAIPPGKEAAIAEMLGKAAALPGGCTWAGASIDRFTIVALYACPGGEVELDLGPVRGAPPGGARTARFAITVKRRAAPLGLVDAVAARVRAREEDLGWQPVAEHPPVEVKEPERPWHASFRVALAAAVATVAAGAAIAVALRRASLRRIGRQDNKALGLLAALVTTASVHGVLVGIGRAMDAALMRRGLAAILAGGGIAVGCAALAAVAVAALAITRAHRALLPAMAALYVAAGYARSLPADVPHRFGSLVTPDPASTAVDTFSARGQLEYHVNALGFRAPEWSVEKAHGATRVVLIGDSYVFGIGVRQDETLSAHLAEVLRRRRPDRSIEVLNLGIPGDNISSHVDLYEEAIRRLAPDIVVVCLTLPNDLSRWDVQGQQRDTRRVSALSFTRFLMGSAALTLFDYARLDQRVTPAGLAHFDAELARLDRDRQAAPGRPFTALFAFGWPDPVLTMRLAKNTEMPLIKGGEPVPEDFIPGDGHPTAHGNERFAEWIAAALADRVP